MKKILLLITILLLSACSKDEQRLSDCNCGIITEVYYHPSYNITTVKIVSDCTGKESEMDLNGNIPLNSHYCNE